MWYVSRCRVQILSLFTLILLPLSCGRGSESSVNDDIYSYAKTVSGQSVTWAYGARVEALQDEPESTGVVFINLTPAEMISSPRARLHLLPSLKSSPVGAGQPDGNDITWVDMHPSRDQALLSYVPYEVGGVRAVARAGSVDASGSQVFDIYFTFYERPKSEASPAVLVGDLRVSNPFERGYVNLRPGLRLLKINAGAHRGRIALTANAQIIAQLGGGVAPVGANDNGVNTQPVLGNSELDLLCADSDSKELGIPSLENGYCQARPQLIEKCIYRSDLKGCIGSAPQVNGPALSGLFGSIDTTNVIALNAQKRQYRWHSQAAVDAETKLVFVAKTIAVDDPKEMATMCRDMFHARAWSFGDRPNISCIISPSAVIEPVQGKLACGVSIKAASLATSEEKNCYVTGSFRGETKRLETVQFFY